MSKRGRATAITAEKRQNCPVAEAGARRARDPFVQSCGEQGRVRSLPGDNAAVSQARRGQAVWVEGQQEAKKGLTGKKPRPTLMTCSGDWTDGSR